VVFVDERRDLGGTSSGTSMRTDQGDEPEENQVRTVCDAIERALAARGIDPDPPPA
jgi:hypothetical protein